MRMAWWVTAPVAAGLMMAASSQPYFTLVKPLLPVEVQRIEAGTAGDFSLPIDGFEDARREATVEVIGLERLEPGNKLGLSTQDGMDLYVAMTQWIAPPESVLYYCRIKTIGSDGREYPNPTLIVDGITRDLSMNDQCTLDGKEGPKIRAVEFLSDEMEIEQPAEPRQPRWKKLEPIVVPHGVQPREMQLTWDRHSYITFVLPEPEDFVDEFFFSGSTPSGTAAPPSGA